MFDTKKAKEVQERLASRLELRWRGGEIRCLGGVDCGYDLRRGKIGAAAVVMKIPGFKVIDVSFALQDIRMPYIPGFLNFREGPSSFRAFRKLKIRPDVLLVDGNGIAHPRKMGLASHLGVVLGLSTVGCAKSAYFPWKPPSSERGSSEDYLNGDSEKVGWILRTRTNVKPVFVSPGNMMDFSAARECVLSCSVFRVPEPLRLAHLVARRLIREGGHSPIRDAVLLRISDLQKPAEGAEAAEKTDHHAGNEEQSTLNQAQVAEPDQIAQNSQGRSEIYGKDPDEDNEQEER